MAKEGLLDAVENARAGVDIEKHFRMIDACLRPRLSVWFTSRLRSRNDLNEVDELVQATIARVYTGMKTLERTEAFLPWVFVIARNVRVTWLLERRRQRSFAASMGRTAQELPRAELDAEEEAREETFKVLRDAVDALPPQQRECLRLRMHQKLSYHQIAATLRLSANTVRNHLAAARRGLRQALSGPPTLEPEPFPAGGAATSSTPPAAGRSTRPLARQEALLTRSAEPVTQPAGRSGTRRSRADRGRSSGGSSAMASPGGGD